MCHSYVNIRIPHVPCRLRFGSLVVTWARVNSKYRYGIRSSKSKPGDSWKENDKTEGASSKASENSDADEENDGFEEILSEEEGMFDVDEVIDMVCLAFFVCLSRRLSVHSPIYFVRLARITMATKLGTSCTVSIRISTR